MRADEILAIKFSKEVLEAVQKVHALKKERKSLSVFDFKKRREIRNQIKKLKIQEKTAYRELKRIDASIIDLS